MHSGGTLAGRVPDSPSDESLEGGVWHLLLFLGINDFKWKGCVLGCLFLKISWVGGPWRNLQGREVIECCVYDSYPLGCRPLPASLQEPSQLTINGPSWVRLAVQVPQKGK